MKGETVLFTGEVRSVHASDNLNTAVSSFSQESKRDELKQETSQPAFKQNDNHERSSLKIDNIQSRDGGEYTCRIMIRSTDEINVTHTIIVQNEEGLSVVTVSFLFLIFSRGMEENIIYNARVKNCEAIFRNDFVLEPSFRIPAIDGGRQCFIVLRAS